MNTAVDRLKQLAEILGKRTHPAIRLSQFRREILDDSGLTVEDVHTLVAIVDDPYLLAQETSIRVPGHDRPTVGYIVPCNTPTFASFEAGSSYIKGLELPLGWVIIQRSQLTIGTRR